VSTCIAGSATLGSLSRPQRPTVLNCCGMLGFLDSGGKRLLAWPALTGL
jgi:hypothetical protein